MRIQEGSNRQNGEWVKRGKEAAKIQVFFCFVELGV